MFALEDEAPIKSIANLIVKQAIAQGADEVLIASDLNLRFCRSDGTEPREVAIKVPAIVAPALISHFKTMADVVTTEAEGRFFVKMNHKKYEIRVSAIMSELGEQLTMRIQGKLDFRHSLLH